MKLNIKRTLLVIVVILFFITNYSLAETIWSEDFSDYSDNSGYIGSGSGAITSGDYPSSITKWSLDVSSATLSASDDWFMVNSVSGNLLFETRDSDGECIWTSESINISNYTGVGIQVTVTESGDHESADYVNLYYKIDSGSETSFETNGSNVGNFPSTTSSQSNLSGSTLVIVIKTKNGAGVEKLRFDDIIVTGTATVTISGNSGFRMMSSPVAGQIYADLLAELWTQGMTSADVTSGDANVWTLDVSNQSWSALSDISASGASLTAGEGFLVYVFSDTDNDGNPDLPVTLSVSGTENSASASLGSIADGNYALAGNPYASTIDWDLVTKTNLTGTTTVWDNASSGWKDWNGSSGSLTNGLIAPFQGFWIQASGGTGSLTIETSHKSSSAGTFYRSVENDYTGSVIFSISSENHSDQTFVSFRDDGEVGLDIADGTKLLPLQASQRVVGLSYTEDHALSIHNLPYENETSLFFPLDVMSLSVDETNYLTGQEEVSLSWNLDNLPDHLSLSLKDALTGAEIDLETVSDYTFTTEAKGSFSAIPNGAVGPYPVVGESRFTVNVSYGALGSNSEGSIPSEFALHPVYPNPFNPSTRITFDVPNVQQVQLDIFNLKGQLVETLMNKLMEPGTHSIQWNPMNTSSGVYMVKLKSGDKTLTQKMSYIK